MGRGVKAVLSGCGESESNKAQRRGVAGTRGCEAEENRGGRAKEWNRMERR